MVPSLLCVHIHTLMFAFSFDFVRQYTLVDYGHIYIPLTHLCSHVNEESTPSLATPNLLKFCYVYSHTHTHTQQAISHTLLEFKAPPSFLSTFQSTAQTITLTKPIIPCLRVCVCVRRNGHAFSQLNAAIKHQRSWSLQPAFISS